MIRSFAVVSTASIDLVSGWNTLWTPFSSSNKALVTIITAVGVALIVFAILKFVWQRQKGQGVGWQTLGWPLAAGAILAGPNLLIPLLLKIAQAVIDFVVKLLQLVTG